MASLYSTYFLSPYNSDVTGASERLKSMATQMVNSLFRLTIRKAIKFGLLTLSEGGWWTTASQSDKRLQSS